MPRSGSTANSTESQSISHTPLAFRVSYTLRFNFYACAICYMPYALFTGSASPVGSWPPGDKGAGRPLIGSIFMTTGSERLGLSPRDPRHFHQRPSHDEWGNESRPPVAGGQRERHDDITPPVQPFEEVVGMPRISPEADPAHTILVPRLAPKQGKLPVGNRLARHGDAPEEKSSQSHK